MSNWWFRIRNTLVDNRKVRELPDDMVANLLWIWCIASEHGGSLPEMKTVAWKLRVSEQRAAAIVTALVAAKLIDKIVTPVTESVTRDACDAVVFRVHDWEMHQGGKTGSDPTGAKRAKEYRDRKKSKRDAPVTRHGDVTAVTSRIEENSNSTATADAATALSGEIFERWGLKDPARVQTWLDAGYPSGFILETIGKVMARGQEVSSLKYFDGILAQANAKREPSPSERAGLRLDIDKVISFWAKTGVWSRYAGPEPGQTGCRATAEQFAAHGIAPDGTKIRRSA